MLILTAGDGVPDPACACQSIDPWGHITFDRLRDIIQDLGTANDPTTTT